MPSHAVSTSRSRQQGGLTIIMALVLVSVLGAAVFSLSRNVVRELSMGGTVIQGEKAAAAADAALDWAITWGQGHMNDAAYMPPLPRPPARTLLVTGINYSHVGCQHQHSLSRSSGPGISAMTIDNGWGGEPATQTYDIEVRFLGTGWGAGQAAGMTSDNNAASGNTKGGASSSSPVGWRILSTGYSTPVGTTQTYQSQREMIATFPY
jgi:hypothetical protein